MRQLVIDSTNYFTHTRLILLELFFVPLCNCTVPNTWQRYAMKMLREHAPFFNARKKSNAFYHENLEVWPINIALRGAWSRVRYVTDQLLDNCCVMRWCCIVPELSCLELSLSLTYTHARIFHLYFIWDPLVLIWGRVLRPPYECTNKIRAYMALH